MNRLYSCVIFQAVVPIIICGTPLEWILEMSFASPDPRGAGVVKDPAPLSYQTRKYSASNQSTLFISLDSEIFPRIRPAIFGDEP